MKRYDLKMVQRDDGILLENIRELGEEIINFCDTVAEDDFLNFYLAPNTLFEITEKIKWGGKK